MCSHTHVHSHVCTHTLTQVHSHMYSPTHTHTCIYAVVCSHKCLRAHTLILTYMQVLISGTWLWFSRVNPPKATSLRESVLHPPQPPRAQAVCSMTSTWWLAKSQELDASWQGQDGFRLWVESREATGLEEVRRGAEQLPAAPTV